MRRKGDDVSKNVVSMFLAGILVGILLTGTGQASRRELFKGAIVMVPAGRSCPSGWATVDGMNGRFPRGGVRGDKGGSADHSHTVTSHAHSMSHTHSIPGLSGHTHSMFFDTWGAQRYGFNGGVYNDRYLDGDYSSYDASPHTHRVSGTTASGGAGTTGTSSTGVSGSSPASTGASSPETSPEDSLPPYMTVRFCQSS